MAWPTHQVNILSANPQNGQTHSNNLSTFAEELLSMFEHFMGVVRKCILYPLKTVKIEKSEGFLVFSGRIK